MNKNMGIFDRIVRIIFALVILLLYLNNQITGTALLILGIVSVIFIITAFVGFCPLYVIFRISTKK